MAVLHVVLTSPGMVHCVQDTHSPIELIYLPGSHIHDMELEPLVPETRPPPETIVIVLNPDLHAYIHPVSAVVVLAVVVSVAFVGADWHVEHGKHGSKPVDE